MTRSQSRGFTLVELLVVIGIIAVLAALLLPAVYSAVVRARNTSMAMEIAQLANAVESYKSDKGDYPPNFTDVSVFVRHVRKCYPKIDQNEFNALFDFDMSGNITDFKTEYKLDEGESLVFWLSQISTDQRHPFSGTEKKSYYDFDQSRLVTADGDTYRSYRPRSAQDSCYVYIDSRSYGFFVLKDSSTGMFANRGAFAEDNTNITRPYGDGASNSGMNAKTFQIICAGQDGVFGEDGVDLASGNHMTKQYPNGLYYTQEDKDNITNFSEGRTLGDSLP